jgi:hypothetical protein
MILLGVRPVRFPLSSCVPGRPRPTRVTAPRPQGRLLFARVLRLCAAISVSVRITRAALWRSRGVEAFAEAHFDRIKANCSHFFHRGAQAHDVVRRFVAEEMDDPLLQKVETADRRERLDIAAHLFLNASRHGLPATCYAMVPVTALTPVLPWAPCRPVRP